MVPDLAPTKTPKTGPGFGGWVQFGDACLVLIDRLLSRQLLHHPRKVCIEAIQHHPHLQAAAGVDHVGQQQAKRDRRQLWIRIVSCLEKRFPWDPLLLIGFR